MGHIVVFAHLPAASSGIKDEYIKRLTACSEYALKNEPGVLKYAVLLPRTIADGDYSVYALEVYADKAAFDSHMETQGVKDMIQWTSTSTEKVFAADPTIRQLEFFDGGFEFSRPSVNAAKDPHVLFADLTYQPGTASQSLPYWKAVVDTGLNDEPGTLVYGVMKDPQNTDKIFVFEAYESPEYLADVHVPSQAIQNSIRDTKHLRTGLTHTTLKLEGGYLHK